MMDRVHKEVNIGSEKVIISERHSIDVYDLYDFEQNHLDNPAAVRHCQSLTIIQGLLPYYETIPWRRFIKKLRVKKIMNVKWIDKHLSVSEKIGLYTDILQMEIEGQKKKTMEKLGKELAGE